jgi:hypothetical protein
MKTSRQTKPEGKKTPDYVRIQLILGAIAIAIVFTMAVIAGAGASAMMQGGAV